jgi:hypothetical protein
MLADSRQSCRIQAKHPTFVSHTAKPPNRGVPENPRKFSDARRIEQPPDWRVFGIGFAM